MSISINPSISLSAQQTTNTISDVSEQAKDYNASAKIIRQQIDTYSSLFESAYSAPITEGLDVIRDAAKAIALIENGSVKSQVIQVLELIQNRLTWLSRFYELFNRLPKILLSVSDDQTSLLEWNFENFRIGFTLEPKKEESHYYLVSQDKQMGTFSASSAKLENEERDKINALVDYVIGNT